MVRSVTAQQNGKPARLHQLNRPGALDVNRLRAYVDSWHYRR